MGVPEVSPELNSYADEQTATKGSTNHLQTSVGTLPALQTIEHHVKGRKVVVRDMSTLLVQIRERVFAKASYRNNTDAGFIRRRLHKEVKAEWKKLDDELRSGLAEEPLVVTVADGPLRPRAKLGEMTQRANAFAKKLANEEFLPCGLKPSEITWGAGDFASVKPYIVEDENNIYVVNADEADRAIHALLTYSFEDPLYVHPSPELLNLPDLQIAMNAISRFPPSNRIVMTRDSDAIMALSGFEAWWVLLPNWTGKLAFYDFSPHDLDMGRYLAWVERMMAEGDITIPGRERDAAAANSQRGGATSGGINFKLSARPQYAIPERTEYCSSVALPWKARVIEELPVGQADTKLVFLPGLDMHPMFPADQERRSKVALVLGNDYVRSGIGGLSRKAVRSGLLEELLDADWDDPVNLGNVLTATLQQMASTSEEASAWRGSGAEGRLSKLSSGQLAPGLVERLVEGYQTLRGYNVLCCGADAHWLGDERGALMFTDLAPPMKRDRDTKRSVGPSGKPYRLRMPTDAAIATPRDQPQFPPTSSTNELLRNPLQARRNVEPPQRPASLPPFIATGNSKIGVAPSGAGPSDLVGSFAKAPEFGHMTADHFRAKLAKTAAASDPATRATATAAAARAGGEHQIELDDELSADEDDDDLDFESDEDDGASGKKKTTAKRRSLHSLFRSVSTTAQKLSAMCRIFTADEPVPDESPTPMDEDGNGASFENDNAPSLGNAAPTSAQRTKGRSGAAQRRARQRRAEGVWSKPGRKGAPFGRRRVSTSSAIGRGRAGAVSVPPTQDEAPSDDGANVSEGDETEGRAGTTQSGAEKRKRRHVKNVPGEHDQPRLACVQPVIEMANLGMQLGLRFIMACLLYFFIARLDENEAGTQAIVRRISERNGLARSMARMAAFGARQFFGRGTDWIPYSKLEDRRVTDVEDEKDAARAVLGLGLTPGPRMPKGVVAQLLLSYQTNVGMWARTHFDPDCRELGLFIGRNLRLHARIVLGMVFRSEHGDYDLQDESIATLSRAKLRARNAFGSSVGELIGAVLAETPYSHESMVAGTAAQDDVKIKLPIKRKRRGANADEKQAAYARQAKGLEGAVPAGARPVPQVVLQDEHEERLEKILTAVTRDLPVQQRETAKATLRTDILELIGRLLAYRDRNLFLGLRAIGVSVTSKGVKKTLAETSFKDLVRKGIEGKATGAKVAKALLPFCIQIRRMRQVKDVELLPFMQPTFFGWNIRRLIDQSQEWPLRYLIRDLGTLVTRIMTCMLGYSTWDDATGQQKRVELFDRVRTLFDVECTDYSDPEKGEGIERATDDDDAGDQIATSPRPLYEIEKDWDGFAPLRFVIKEKLQSYAYAVVPTLRRIVAIGQGRLQSQEPISAELLNVAFDRTLIPTEYIPTGHFNASAHFITTFCVETSGIVSEEYSDMRKQNLDAGLSWATACKEPWHQLDLTRYDRREAFERRGQDDGSFVFEPILPLADDDLDEMVKRRAPAPGQTPEKDRPARDALRTEKLAARRVRRQLLRLRRPVDSRARLRRSPRKKPRTEKGVPVTWVDVETAEGRQVVRDFTENVPLERQAWHGVDPGEVVPVAMRSSVPTELDQVGGDGRAEACMYISRGALLDETQRTSRRASHLNTFMSKDFSFERTPDYDPLANPLVITGLDVFKRTNSLYEERQTRSKVQRRAEIESACSQLVDLILGGDEAIDVEERKRRRHIVAVGKGGDSALGRRKKGPQVANTILRQLDLELRSRDIDFLLCVVPEWYTSQKCPRANCVDENGNRSQCRYIIHENGRDELRVLHCTGCRGIFHRDGTGSNNNVVQARCYVVLDAAFFGEDWTKYFEV